MNLIFISREQYPDGGAPANRHIAYSKGLMELGHKVTFVLLSRQARGEARFIYEDILFICADLKHANAETGFFSKLFLQTNLIISAQKTIKTIKKHEGIDALFLLTTWNQDLIPLICLNSYLNLKVLHERTEYPFIDSRPGFRGRFDLWLYLHFIEKKFDGIYVINNMLANYFRTYLRNKVPVEIINMIVDPGRFETLKREKNNHPRYIAYCGVLNSAKDGVDILIESYIAAVKSGRIPDDVGLWLIGEYSNDLFKSRINNIIFEAALQDKIIFTGRLGRMEVPEYLNNAEALALARPANKQSEGGFPTKLGEYLATGKPVIVTNTGEISLFLKDGVNAFIAEPGNVRSFTDKIVEVFSDYSRAIEIGMNGRKLADTEFNYLKQAEKLANFIMSLK